MKKGYKKGWKVTKRNLNSLYETYTPVQYSYSKFVKPNKHCGPMTVLTTKEGAEYLLEHTCVINAKIHKCIYLPSKEDRVWSTLFSSPLGGLTVETLERENSIILLPGTTALADKVRLVE